MRKKSIEKSCDWFASQIDEIDGFLELQHQDDISDQHISWLYNYAIISLYRQFEGFVLDCLVALINNNTKVLSQTTGYSFPKHLTDEVCEYLIVGNGFFDFKGRSGLIKTLNDYLPRDHWFIDLMKADKYKSPLDQLSALRNYAAHESSKS